MSARESLWKFLHRHCDYDREWTAWEMRCTHLTQWIGPLGIELALPLVWRSRLHWTWGYWR